MAKIYVARSAKLSDWASDVGLSKHIFKVGVAEDPKAEIAKGWAGETDWTLVKAQEAGEVTEEQALERLARKDKLVDPTYYPRIKGAAGIFKVPPNSVQNHIVLTRALAGEGESLDVKIKTADFAQYLIANALK
ncbi:MAG TPA: hypothetical protein VED40_05710 [Azospirillaceae bacterium]|nr:hypothetical protein [Azospirillaceae bacterium]